MRMDLERHRLAGEAPPECLVFLRLEKAQAQAQVQADRGRVAESLAQATACEAAKVTVAKVVGPRR